MKYAVIVGLFFALAGCAYTPPLCHTAGEDYTAGDACR